MRVATSKQARWCGRKASVRERRRENFQSILQYVSFFLTLLLLCRCALQSLLCLQPAPFGTEPPPPPPTKMLSQTANATSNHSAGHLPWKKTLANVALKNMRPSRIKLQRALSSERWCGSSFLLFHFVFAVVRVVMLVRPGDALHAIGRRTSSNSARTWFQACANPKKQLRARKSTTHHL